MERKSKLNITSTQMEALIETMMWFWGNLHQRWRFAAEDVCGLATTEKIEKIFIADVGRSHARGLKKIFEVGNGINGLMEAFRFLPENFIEPFEVAELSDKHVLVKNPLCTAQKARLGKGRKVYPCKDVAILYFTEFAREIDPNIRMDCIICPPDQGHNCTCQWRFEAVDKV